MIRGDIVNYVADEGVQIAIVLGPNEDGTHELLAADANGAWTVRHGVPHVDPENYGPQGGGHSWHYVR